MTITVKSLDGKSYNLPYYKNMRAGQYVTQIVAPAVGCPLHNGDDVYDNLVLNGAYAFTKDNRDKFLSQIIKDDATLHHSMCLGKIPACLIGNGNHMSPTQYHLTLDPSVFPSGDAPSGGDAPSNSPSDAPSGDDTPSACKKRRV